MIHTGEMMTNMLSDNYSSPACKLSRMVGDGEVIRLKRGVYETDFRTPPYLVAQDICGPSYISFEYALSRHELIPERVHEITCATCNKRRTKRFTTPLGRFSYSDVPEAAFHLGVETWSENGREYRIATPAKAVCDKLYKMPPVRDVKSLTEMMFDDLRLDQDGIESLDPEVIGVYADAYRSTTIRTLSAYMRSVA